MSKLVVSTRRIKINGLPNCERWEALLRDEKRRIVWACGHSHAWRSGSFSETTAMACAFQEKERRSIDVI